MREWILGEVISKLNSKKLFRGLFYYLSTRSACKNFLGNMTAQSQQSKRRAGTLAPAQNREDTNRRFSIETYHLEMEGKILVTLSTSEVLILGAFVVKAPLLSLG
jgi:hypothetical protein